MHLSLDRNHAVSWYSNLTGQLLSASPPWPCGTQLLTCRVCNGVFMFLEALSLKKFRSFEDERICFEKDLTILVGENNGGKSNAIDALRLITTPLSGRREIYCETADIRFGSAEPKFELEVTFADLSVAQQGRLISAVTDHTLQKAIFGLSYDESKKRLPARPTVWAGHLNPSPAPDCQQPTPPL